LIFLSLEYCILDPFCLRYAAAQEAAQEKDAEKKPISPKKNRTLIDMTTEELQQSYGTELRGMEFIQSRRNSIHS
jgi:hypothetical protein